MYLHQKTVASSDVKPDRLPDLNLSRYIRLLPYAARFAMLLLGLGIYCHGSGDYWLYDDHPNLVNNPDLQLDGSELDDWEIPEMKEDGQLARLNFNTF